jgi:hypothetical protein
MLFPDKMTISKFLLIFYLCFFEKTYTYRRYSCRSVLDLLVCMYVCAHRFLNMINLKLER